MPTPSAPAAPLDPRVQTVIDGDYFDYREPLRRAWEWNRTNDPADRTLAEQLLRHLAEEADFALPVWFERVFNLVKHDPPRRPEALRMLADDVAPRFNKVLDVDTLSLWGRLLKDQASDFGKAGRFAEAEAEYAKAEDKYERSYREHRDRFPGINVATIRLLRAAVLAALLAADRKRAAGTDRPGLSAEEVQDYEGRISALRADSAGRAAEVLASHEWWVKKLADDDIWMAATEAEAFALQQKWERAEERYRSALNPDKKPLAHHADSMRVQLERLVTAFQELGVVVPPPLDNPKAFFHVLLKP